MVREWKIIKEFPNYYVSNLGEIKSIHRENEMKGGYLRGYRHVTLRKNNKQYTKKVHRLVAQTWIPNPENKPTINHKNGIKDDNRVENLEWNTYSENENHAYNIGLKTDIRILGKENKLSIKIIGYNPLTKEKFKFYGIREAARILKCTNAPIQKSLKKGTKCKGLIFKYDKTLEI